jgi:hypothetical protein
LKRVFLCLFLLLKCPTSYLLACGPKRFGLVLIFNLFPHNQFVGTDWDHLYGHHFIYTPMNGAKFARYKLGVLIRVRLSNFSCVEI